MELKEAIKQNGSAASVLMSELADTIPEPYTPPSFTEFELGNLTFETAGSNYAKCTLSSLSGPEFSRAMLSCRVKPVSIRINKIIVNGVESEAKYTELFTEPTSAIQMYTDGEPTMYPMHSLSAPKLYTSGNATKPSCIDAWLVVYRPGTAYSPFILLRTS